MLIDDFFFFFSKMSHFYVPGGQNILQRRWGAKESCRTAQVHLPKWVSAGLRSLPSLTDTPRVNQQFPSSIESPSDPLQAEQRERREGERGMERGWHQSSFSEAVAMFHPDVQTLTLSYKNQIIAWKAVDSKWALYKLTSSTAQTKLLNHWW